MQTVDRSVRVAGEAVRQALATRKAYTTDDINFVVTSLTADAEETITIEVIARFCIRTYVYSNTGRYSFSFNAILRKTVEIKSAGGIRMLAMLAETEAFPELYKNELLTTHERAKIITMINREYLSTVNMLNMAISKTDDRLTLFGQLKSEHHYKTKLVVKTEHYSEVKPCLYNTAYKYVMMQELAGVDLGFSGPISSMPPKTIFVKGEVEHELEIREVDYLYFIMQLAKESPIIRDIRLRGDIMEFMSRKYASEIKLCKYWRHNPI
uniref:Uncharacterized protein n=1 Tax=Pithovirus LCPAC103 TaxID=2506588 RepID=A0A481Z4X8_9VIRU|nr:MAG: uncharacterized protein LCPAC103_01530 [Pithovirus LCPAC103]